MWRPEGWENHFAEAYKNSKDTEPDFAVQSGMQGIAYEAGAEVMLQLLRMNGDKFKGGWHVFIPEEE